MSPIHNCIYLDEQVFPDPSWCVPGILPEGSCILSGHPKIGKSFLVLAIASVKVGRRRLIPESMLIDYINNIIEVGSSVGGAEPRAVDRPEIPEAAAKDTTVLPR